MYNECFKAHIYFGVYAIILLLTSIISNGLLIWKYLKNRKYLCNIHVLKLTLVILNIIGALIDLPLVILNSFSCKYKIGRYGCYLEGFTLFLTATSSIYILLFISCIRYSTVRTLDRPRRAKNFNIAIKSITISILIGFFWSSMPFFGWSEYNLEGLMISCSVEWNKKTFSVISYNISIMIFVYIIPLITFIYTNSRIIHYMKSIRKTLAHIYTNEQIQKKIKAEKRVTISSVVLICGFFMCWTPYSILCIYKMFNSNGADFSPLGTTIIVFVAKSSLCWPALFTLFEDKDIRNNFEDKKFQAEEINLRDKRKSYTI